MLHKYCKLIFKIENSLCRHSIELGALAATHYNDWSSLVWNLPIERNNFFWNVKFYWIKLILKPKYLTKSGLRWFTKSIKCTAKISTARHSNNWTICLEKFTDSYEWTMLLPPLKLKIRRQERWQVKLEGDFHSSLDLFSEFNCLKIKLHNINLKLCRTSWSFYRSRRIGFSMIFNVFCVNFCAILIEDSMSLERCKKNNKTVNKFIAMNENSLKL